MGLRQLECLLRPEFQEVSHRERERTEGYYVQSNGRHGCTVGAWSNGGCLQIVLELYCKVY